MNHARSSIEMRLERRAARNAMARSLARLSTYALGICFLAATWQERALAPSVHDGMIVVADTATTFIYESENGGYATALSTFGDGGIGSEYSPITDLLLNMRN